MRLGIFGGTFDPVHIGHLAVAECVRAELELDCVLFVPAGRPWFKDGLGVSDARHRLEMVRLAISDNPHFDLSDIEVLREGPTYTVDTLVALRAARGDCVEFSLILGMDALNDLHRWSRPSEVLDMATVIGVSRPGAPPLDRAALESLREGASDDVRIVRGPLIRLSGFDIRRRVAAGQSVSGLVPAAVLDYIDRQGLYRREGLA